VTLVEGCADDRIRAATYAFLTRVDSRAEITIVAGCVFGKLWIGAQARRRVADAYTVTLVECRADHGVAPGARSCLAGIALGAEVTVVARRAVGLWRFGAQTCGGIADANAMALSL
jgi:hypothetical protein